MSSSAPTPTTKNVRSGGSRRSLSGHSPFGSILGDNSQTSQADIWRSRSMSCSPSFCVSKTRRNGRSNAERRTGEANKRATWISGKGALTTQSPGLCYRRPRRSCSSPRLVCGRFPRNPMARCVAIERNSSATLAPHGNPWPQWPSARSCRSSVPSTRQWDMGAYPPDHADGHRLLLVKRAGRRGVEDHRPR